MKKENRKGHTNGVNSVVVNFDGRFMISKDKNYIKIWDIVEGKELKTMMIKDEEFPFGLDLFNELEIGWFVRGNEVNH